MKDKYSVSDYVTKLPRDKPGRLSSNATVATPTPAIEVRNALPQPGALASSRTFLKEINWLDLDFYVSFYPDASTSGLTPEEHFWQIGLIEGRSPNFYVDPNWYMATNPGLEAFGKPALYHYARHGDFEGRPPSGIFDPKWYRAEYKLTPEQNALSHYLLHRKSGNFSPIPQFDVAFYCRVNPDIADVDPFQHFVTRGYHQGRDPSNVSDIEAYWGRNLRGAGEINPVLSYIAIRALYGPLGQIPTFARVTEGVGSGLSDSVGYDQRPGLREGYRTLPDPELEDGVSVDETRCLSGDRVGPGLYGGPNEDTGAVGEVDRPGSECRAVETELPQGMDGGSEPDAIAFDEDDYLAAFPELATAISAGIFASATQHYLEHGRRENRLSQDRYRLACRGRLADGHIDFYGHNSLAGGWIFCGWTSEPWDENDPMSIVARFHNGDVSGECFSAKYRRRHLKEGGTGLVLFIQGSSEPLGALISVAVRKGGVKIAISAGPGAYQLDHQAIASEIRSILVKEQGSDNSRELLLLLSTRGYGRFSRPPLNTLDGFIDFYGYYGTSGSWCLCGWTTRSWDQEVEPESLTLHFADGYIVSKEYVAGFYRREDIDGKGVGFVMAVRGVDRPLGDLICVALHRGNLSCFFQAAPAIKRCREAELTERLRSISGQVADPASNRAFTALLSRTSYTGSDTLAGLSDLVFLEFDEVILCPPAGVVLMGWLLARPGALRALRLRSGDLSEEFDLSACVKVDRSDVISAVGAQHGFDDTRCGFIAYLPANVPPDAQLYMEVETSQRQIGYRKLPAPKLDGISATRRILDAFNVRYSDVPLAYDRTVGPAIELLNRRRLAQPPRADVIEFGSVHTSPRFSVIIPLYGRLDFTEYQMAFMSGHPAAKDYEFIFVLDDPPKRLEALHLFDSVHSRFGIPFRVLFLEHNVGFAPANNAGLRSANGTYVCFLNSDVFPGTPDWLERLALRLEQNPDIGAVGPLLLYGDGTVQHEGMDFRNLPEFGNWLFGDHPRKGMRKSSQCGLRKHISITGASILMKRELARELGGFDESYVIGDFEDSDLCLRLHAIGLDSAVDLDVELYHLERKSQASAARTWRMNLTLYNAWVHQRRWGDAIAAHPLRQVTCGGSA